MKMYELFLTCPKGLESVCKKDLNDLSLSKIKLEEGGISLKGTIEDIYKINLHSRIGMNLLIKIVNFKFKNINDFYDKIYNYKWNNFINPKMTLYINTIQTKNKSIFKNSQFATLKAKDAICDKLTKLTKKRPSINKESPDISIRLLIDEDDCFIYANSSGNPLYMRNYKQNFHKASINESLASALVYLSNWNKEDIFLDPMCGSGTICMEASMIKRKIAPGIFRDFSFQNWLNYDYHTYQAILNKAIKNIDEQSKNNIFGSDLSSDHITGCKDMLQSFKFNLGLNFNIKNISNFKANNKKYHIVTNPPYQIRIGTETDLLFIHKGLKKILSSESQIYLLYPIDSDFITKNYKYEKLATIYNGSIKCGFYKIINV